MSQQTVTISCIKGIDRLIELGRTVAQSGTWTVHPNAREAFVGLWLDATLTRASLRGRAQNSSGTIEAQATNEPVYGDAALIDQAAKDWIDYTAELAKLVGETPYDATNVDIRLPADAGAWPLAVLCVVLGTGIAAGGWIGGKVVDWWISKGDRGTAEDMVAAGAAQTLALGEAAMQQNRSLTEAEKLAIANRHNQTMAVIANLTAKKQDAPLFGASDGLIGAGLILGLLYVLTRSPK
jgi:hypothetical protein